MEIDVATSVVVVAASTEDLVGFTLLDGGVMATLPILCGTHVEVLDFNGTGAYARVRVNNKWTLRVTRAKLAAVRTKPIERNPEPEPEPEPENTEKATEHTEPEPEPKRTEPKEPSIVTNTTTTTVNANVFIVPRTAAVTVASAAVLLAGLIWSRHRGPNR